MVEKVINRKGADVFLVQNEIPGESVLLINGYSRSHSDFKAMMRFFEGEGVGSVTLDNRGAGKSIARVPFSIEDMVADVLAVLDELEIPKVSFVGISMGGIILQRLIEMHPNRVHKAVFVSTTPKPDSIVSENHSWPDSEEDIYNKMTSYFSDSFVAKNKILIKAMAKNIAGSIQDGDFKVQSGLQSDAIRNASLDRTADPINIQAMVIHGEEDKIIPVQQAFLLKDRFVSCESLIYEGAGHLLIAEKGKTLYADILSFINNS